MLGYVHEEEEREFSVPVLTFWRVSLRTEN
jgi:hypothetical protein